MADDGDVNPPRAPPPPTRPSSDPLPPLVEELSSTGISSPGPSSRYNARHSNARPLSRTSLESTMIELAQVSQGISATANASWVEPPDTSLRRPFWLLKLIRNTITTGGFVTPRFHVPRLVWEQYGAKLNGLATKTSAFEEVLALLVNRVLPLELLGDNDDQGDDLAKVQRTLHVFADLRAELDMVQNTLARPFPFIKEVASTTTQKKNSGAPTTSTTASSSSDAGGMQQQFRGLMASFGKKVRKSAVSAYTAYERMGVALPAKITDEELVSYASLVADVCDKAQCLDVWFVCLDARRKGQRGTDEAMHQCLERILVELLHAARFVQEVVVELLLRDLDTLVESYLRKMRKSFSRMTWELEEPDG